MYTRKKVRVEGLCGLEEREQYSNRLGYKKKGSDQMGRAKAGARELRVREELVSGGEKHSFSAATKRAPLKRNKKRSKQQVQSLEVSHAVE